jgi:hypothetical protein
VPLRVSCRGGGRVTLYAPAWAVEAARRRWVATYGARHGKRDPSDDEIARTLLGVRWIAPQWLGRCALELAQSSAVQ